MIITFQNDQAKKPKVTTSHAKAIQPIDQPKVSEKAKEKKKRK